MFVAGTVLVLYFWMFFNGSGELSTRQLVPDYAAIAAGVTFLFSAMTYFWSPRRAYFPFSLIGYLLLVSMAAVLLASTGGADSSFVALWILIAVFAPVFGWWGITIIGLYSGSYLAWMILQQPVDIGKIGMTLLMSTVPIVVGVLAWSRSKKSTDEPTEAEQAYHDLSHKLSSVAGQSEVVIMAIADGVIALNQTGEIQLINPAAQQMIGWGQTEAIGLNYKSVLKLLDDKNQPVDDTTDPIAKTLASNLARTTTDFSITTNDSEKTFLAHITISPTGNESRSGVIIVFRDITKEHAEEREQTEFISTASHEMRTPVASIEGYLGLALNPATATIDDKAREYITKAHEASQHLGRLFQDLLDVTKADDGRLSNNPRLVDVVTFVARIVEGQLPRARAKNLHVIYTPIPEIDVTAKPVNADHTVSPVFYTNVDNDHLREVIDNLIENAIKYTPSGDIVVDVVGDADSVTISVKDSGIGIAQEDIPHLFQKFYRIDNSDTREIGGTGLGLYLCRKLTESMGGRLWVESTYKQGSTFFLTLPRVDHMEAQRLLTIETTPAAQLTAPTVLGDSTPAAPTVSLTPSRGAQPVIPRQPEGASPQMTPGSVPGRSSSSPIRRTIVVTDRPST